MANFNAQFATVGVAVLGFTAATVTEVANDNESFQFLASNTGAIDSFVDAVRQFRIFLTEGNIGEPNPDYPTNPTAVPSIDVPTGIFERLDDLVKRIRVAPNYTPEIGALLGIIGSTPLPTPPEDLKPVIKASESMAGYKFNVNVTRLGMTAFKVQVQKSGEATWTDSTFATNNPAQVVVSPTVPGQPERVLVRAWLLDKNEEVGLPSDPTYVTANP